jgi:CBS domain containing-hemolysin-like protein
MRNHTRSIRPVLLASIGLLSAPAAHASFLAGEALDTAADYIALFILFVVPVVLVAGFWFVHILPEKIAEQREHPQKDAIKALCLLSLVFGGLLWPIAWIIAYSKPVLYKLAYGKDKHDDYYQHLAETDAPDAASLGTDVTRLRAELDTLAARGKLPAELQEMRERLLAIEARVVTPVGKPGATAGTGQGAG